MMHLLLFLPKYFQQLQCVLSHCLLRDRLEYSEFLCFY
jgi:hypothetical protein